MSLAEIRTITMGAPPSCCSRFFSNRYTKFALLLLGTCAITLGYIYLKGNIRKYTIAGGSLAVVLSILGCCITPTTCCNGANPKMRPAPSQIIQTHPKITDEELRKDRLGNAILTAIDKGKEGVRNNSTRYYANGTHYMKQSYRLAIYFNSIMCGQGTSGPAVTVDCCPQRTDTGALTWVMHVTDHHTGSSNAVEVFKGKNYEHDWYVALLTGAEGARGSWLLPLRDSSLDGIELFDPKGYYVS